MSERFKSTAKRDALVAALSCMAVAQTSCAAGPNYDTSNVHCEDKVATEAPLDSTGDKTKFLVSDNKTKDYVVAVENDGSDVSLEPSLTGSMPAEYKIDERSASSGTDKVFEVSAYPTEWLVTAYDLEGDNPVVQLTGTC